MEANNPLAIRCDGEPNLRLFIGFSTFYRGDEHHLSESSLFLSFSFSLALYLFNFVSLLLCFSLSLFIHSPASSYFILKFPSSTPCCSSLVSSCWPSFLVLSV